MSFDPRFDPRLTPARPDLAAAHLRGQVQAARFVEGTEFEVFDPVASVRRSPVPDALLETEALKGERVTIYDQDGEGWGWGQLHTDCYVGWLPMNALRVPAAPPTHQVAVLRTILFPGRSIKAQPVEGLPLGCRHAITRRSMPPRRISSPWPSALSACPICGAARPAWASTARAWCRSRSPL